MRKLDYQEVSDILTGCTILGDRRGRFASERACGC